MIDIYLHAPALEFLIADLAALDCGLVAEGQLVPVSHRHALDYVGEIPGEDGVHANLRALDPELAAVVEAAAFPNGTRRIYPNTPSQTWA